MIVLIYMICRFNDVSKTVLGIIMKVYCTVRFQVSTRSYIHSVANAR